MAYPERLVGAPQDSAPSCISIHPDTAALESYRVSLGLTDYEKALEGLALALLSSECLRRRDSLHIVVRTSPSPLLVLVETRGLLREADVGLQLRTAMKTCGALDYVDYPQVEGSCVRLAEALVETLGAEHIARCMFSSMPRGGGFVLGMLAYLMGLGKEQLDRPSPGRTLVVVDDIALTGERFKHHLAAYRHDADVVFAPLFSHPDLRSAIAANEPRVVACVSGADLPTRHPADEQTLDAWQRQHGQRTYGVRVSSAHLCFPWKEPSRFVWDPQAGELRRCWRVLPPSRCLETRNLEGTLRSRVHRQPQACGPLRPADSVISLVVDDHLLIADTESGLSYRLSGSGLDIWSSMLELGTREAVIEELSRTHDVDPALLSEQVHALIDELHGQSVLRGP